MVTSKNNGATRHALLPAIRESLAEHPRLILEAPPGAGKTTQVPLALLDADWLAGSKILTKLLHVSATLLAVSLRDRPPESLAMRTQSTPFGRPAP